MVIDFPSLTFLQEKNYIQGLQLLNRHGFEGLKDQEGGPDQGL